LGRHIRRHYHYKPILGYHPVAPAPVLQLAPHQVQAQLLRTVQVLQLDQVQLLQVVLGCPQFSHLSVRRPKNKVLGVATLAGGVEALHPEAVAEVVGKLRKQDKQFRLRKFDQSGLVRYVKLIRRSAPLSAVNSCQL
jgi:hypothetical protein